MTAPDTHGLCYRHVDNDPNVAVLVNTMDTTSRWTATKQLRAWEREQLRLTEGQRLLDVGCGLGEAALALAHDLGDTGTIVGIDKSAEMVRVANERASAARYQARFLVGDANALDQPNQSFDAVRSERTLQWLPNPSLAVAEVTRVVCPGGRVSLIDTDWSSFAIDVGVPELSELVRKHVSVERNRPSHVGRRLQELMVSAGLTVVGQTSAAHTWDSWDPDETPSPDGCFSMESLATDLVEAGHLEVHEADAFVSTIKSAARERRFAMSLTMFAVVAVPPTMGARRENV